MWSAILLSALAFNLSFFFPDVFGFLIVFFLVPLWYRLVIPAKAGIQSPLQSLATSDLGPRLRGDDVKKLRMFHLQNNSRFTAGLFWGLLVFGPHFTWLLQVLWQHSQAAGWLCVLAYSGVVGYFALTCGVWFWLTRWGGWVNFVFITIAYWWFIVSWSLWPMGLGTGYPFINPLIPLASYRWFLKIIMLCVAGWYGGSASMPASIACTYVPPVVNKIKNATALWRTNPEGVGQAIYHALGRLPVSSNKLLVAPESMFSFPLNEHPEFVRLWSAVLQPDQDFLLGSVLKEQGRYYQAVFWLHARLIKKIYVKKILTPFVEKIPECWKNYADLKAMFLHGFVEFDDSRFSGSVEFFDIPAVAPAELWRGRPAVRIVPRICLEFFFTTRADIAALSANNQTPVVVFHFVNDSWFNRPFKTILHNLSRLKAATLGVPVVWIGHEGLDYF